MSEFVSSTGYPFEDRSPFGFYLHRGLDTLAVSSLEEEAIREFFEHRDQREKEAPAHHRAQPGEVWDLDSTQGKTCRLVNVEGDFLDPLTGVWYDLDEPVFTGGVKVL